MGYFFAKPVSSTVVAGRIFKGIAKIIAGALSGVPGFVCIYLFTVFVASRITVEKETGSKDEVVIYIRTNGVHTDIVVPVHTDVIDWSHEVTYANTSLADTSYPYLALGWGDKGFYLQTPNWSDLKFSVAFNAAFARSTTAIHATFYKQLTENERCRKIMVSREQYGRLVQYILSSFRKDEHGHLMKINTNANYGVPDAFYEANGSYSLFRTCNTWANSALKQSGQKCCLWIIFDTGIFLMYEK